MWYLSRTPCNSSPQPSVVSRTSIFSASDTGFLENLSFVITEDGDEEDARHNYGNPWQWFAYECAPTQFTGVAVPRKTQIILVLPDYFVCARMISSPSNAKLKAKSNVHAKLLCIYSRTTNQLVDVPSNMGLEQGQDRNLLTAACALMGMSIYVAGGYKAMNSSDTEEKPSTPLDSAERFSCATLEWETLPAMLKPQAYSTGLVHRGLFYCIGDENYGHSAQIYHPSLNKWFLENRFIPEEANGYSVGSVNGRMILLTWSTILGIKLWQRVSGYGDMAGNWSLVQFCYNTEVARAWIDRKGAKLVRIHKELFILVGEYHDFCWVDGLCAWPILPAPAFCLSDGQKILHSEQIPAFGFTRWGNALNWSQYPLYRVGCPD